MDIYLKAPDDFQYWYDLTLMIQKLPSFYYTIQMHERRTWVKFDAAIPGETRAECKEILKLVTEEIKKLRGK